MPQPRAAHAAADRSFRIALRGLGGKLHLSRHASSGRQHPCSRAAPRLSAARRSAISARTDPCGRCGSFVLRCADRVCSVNANARMLERSLRAVWHPCTQMKHHETLPLVPISRAEGVWLYDLEGRRILDAISSWWVNLLGHGNPRINAALRRQLDSLEHVMLAGFTHAPAVELAQRLAKLAPGGLGHCFFASDGASAVEIALKMSYHYWKNSGRPEKNRFLTLANSYHVETPGGLRVTDIPLYRDTYAPLLRASAQVPSPDWRLAEPG